MKVETMRRNAMQRESPAGRRKVVAIPTRPGDAFALVGETAVAVRGTPSETPHLGRVMAGGDISHLAVLRREPVALSPDDPAPACPNCGRPMVKAGDVWLCEECITQPGDPDDRIILLEDDPDDLPFEATPDRERPRRRLGGCGATGEAPGATNAGGALRATQETYP
jgi:hypothetical protein